MFFVDYLWYTEEYISNNLLTNPTSSVRLASTTLPDGKYYLQQYNEYDDILKEVKSYKNNKHMILGFICAILLFTGSLMFRYN